MSETNGFVEIFSLFTKKWSLTFNINPVLLIILVIVFVVLIIGKLRRRETNYNIVEIELPSLLGEKIKIKPDYSTINIAYKTWIELITRKVALNYEEDKDVIVEVYNSWYQTFGILRELAKSISAHNMRDDGGMRSLISLMIKVLNEGLRPHLTTWQAKFRRWYNAEIETNPDKTPQEIQKEFPEYDLLVNDIKKVNRIMQEYSASLEKIVKGN
ncbi:MAG: hypothetical protein ABIF18_02540 [archaeon]